MKNTIKVSAKGMAQLSNAESASPGESIYSLNLREREDSLQAVGACTKVCTLRNGESILTIVSTNDGDHYITSIGNNIYLHGVNRDGIYTPLCRLLTIVTGTIISTENVGQYIVINTTQGIVSLLRNGENYTRFSIKDIAPHIHFSATENTQFSHTIAAINFQSGYTSWTSLRSEDTTQIATALRNAVRTIQASIKAQGRLSGVMLVRYGVRLADDSYLYLSAPVLVGAQEAASVCSYITTSTVSDSNKITGTAPCNAAMLGYRLGITPSAAFPAEYDSLIKSIDILASDELDLHDLNTQPEVRCTTTNVGSRTYNLQFAPAKASTDAIAAQLLGTKSWRVISSTTNFNALRNHRWESSNTASSSQPISAYLQTSALQFSNSGTDITAAELENSSTSTMHFGCTAVHSGRLIGGNITRVHNLATPIATYFSGKISDYSCAAFIKVTIADSDGSHEICQWSNIPFSPSALNPIIAYPDSRATHIAITLQGGGNVMTWEGDLTPIAGRNMAANISHNFAYHSLTDTHQTLINIPDATSYTESLHGSMYISSKDNPLTGKILNILGGEDIVAISLAMRPINSSGFGRYPLYIFSHIGIYALPQTISGTYGEPRLLSHQQLARGSRPCEASNSIFFINKDHQLMVVKGDKVTRKIRNTKATSLAWCDVEEELWMLTAVGNISVLMPSGRTYHRTESADRIWSKGIKSIMQTGNDIFNIANEQTSGLTTVEWHSHPITVNELLASCPRRAIWNVFGSCKDLQLQVCGERGYSCHGFRVATLRVNGVVNDPIDMKLITPQLRTIRLSIVGKIEQGALILPTIISR